RALGRRFGATAGLASRGMNLLRAVSSEGFGRLRYHREIRRRLDVDREFRPYFEQETARLPRFYTDLVRRDLGPLWPVAAGGGAGPRPQRRVRGRTGPAGGGQAARRSSGRLTPRAARIGW